MEGTRWDWDLEWIFIYIILKWTYCLFWVYKVSSPASSRLVFVRTMIERQNEIPESPFHLWTYKPMLFQGTLNLEYSLFPKGILLSLLPPAVLWDFLLSTCASLREGSWDNRAWIKPLFAQRLVWSLTFVTDYPTLLAWAHWQSLQYARFWGPQIPQELHQVHQADDSDAYC